MLIFESAIDYPVQGVTLANDDNLSTVGRQSTSVVEEPAVFMTRAEVEQC